MSSAFVFVGLFFRNWVEGDEFFFCVLAEGFPFLVDVVLGVVLVWCPFFEWGLWGWWRFFGELFGSVLCLDGDVSGSSNDIKGDWAVCFYASVVVYCGVGGECCKVGVGDKEVYV